MRTLAVTLTLAVGLATATGDANASSRINCQCKTGKKTWIMGTNACEYHFKKPFRVTRFGNHKPAKYCTSSEVASFKRTLCADACGEK